MSWFCAETQFSTVVAGWEGTLLESSFVLVCAEDKERANERALHLSREREHSYLNSEGEQVDWQFRGIVEVQSIDAAELVDGVELYSRLSTRT